VNPPLSTAPGRGSFRRTFQTRLRRTWPPVDAAALGAWLLAGFAFYLLSGPFVLHPAVPVELPEARFDGGVTSDALYVVVSRQGAVFLRDRPVSMDELRAEFVRAVAARSDVHLLIAADRNVAHGVATDILDLAAECGIRRAALATRPSSAPTPTVP